MHGETVKQRMTSELGGSWMDCSGSGQGEVAGPCEHGDTISNSIKVGNFSSKWEKTDSSTRALLRVGMSYYKLRGTVEERVTLTANLFCVSTTE
jgi:hypothetical protein